MKTCRVDDCDRPAPRVGLCDMPYSRVRRTGTTDLIEAPQRNNQSGVTGVYRHNQTGRWATQVGHNGKHHYGGLYDTIEEAAEAVQRMRVTLGVDR